MGKILKQFKLPLDVLERITGVNIQTLRLIRNGKIECSKKNTYLLKSAITQYFKEIETNLKEL